MSDALLTVSNLKKYFPIRKGVLRRTVGHVKAVDDVSFTVQKGETLGIVGESGCGKSTMGRSILRLIEPTGGEVKFENTNLTKLSKGSLRTLRQKMQIVFQDPYASLNPKFKIGTILERPMQIHGLYTPAERRKRVASLLERCGLDPSAAEKYPNEFSGGQRQRIGIARALTLNPSLIVLDEPVSALDVSVQSQIINLLEDLQEAFSLTYLFIAHDLSVVRHISDRIAVMYLGQTMELAESLELFEAPLHPYTQALLSAIPVPDPDVKRERILLRGDLPSPANPPAGCPFHTRCKDAKDICKTKKPVWKEVRPGHHVACHLYS
ncbi:oligopeptide transport ATP-binding protein AppF [Alicyclobacillus contaminans]|uniref:ABC transporter ATP-binding protein n=1 Tax=Alicyclobacillus contaminans TaxID=392016 RepID=UPI000422B8BF|nr:dipeptide ABC transporter ATP-binding protein [Alicyclobacillus contaminans]GMA51119.1 oligopeptide transport ATP-binding protein AppF [Alicyclobacillus contaminans]